MAVDIYDVNSAYPAALAMLRDPRRLILRQVRTPSDRCIYGAYRVRVDIPQSEWLGPIPYVWRRTGEAPLLVYPTGRFEAWIDRLTLDTLEDERMRYTVEEGWELQRAGIRMPPLLFPEIQRFYALRLKEPRVKYAVKIFQNAGYGALAQKREDWKPSRRVGLHSLNVEGRWYNRKETLGAQTHMALAAYVTAFCRRELWRAARAFGRKRVLYMSTDSLIVLHGPIPKGFHVGDGLGEWKRELSNGEAVIVGGGIYSYRKGRGRWKTKLRGHASRVSLVSLLRSRPGTVYAVKGRHARTLAEAGMDPDFRGLNVISEIERNLNLNMDEKRHWPRPARSGMDFLNRNQGSEPLVILDPRLIRGRKPGRIRQDRRKGKWHESRESRAATASGRKFRRVGRSST